MKKGFTLIELLVVIGIIGLLVSIAVPNFLSARQRASDSKKKSEMQQLKNALRLYYNDFNTYPASFTATGKVNYIKGCGTDGAGECPCVSGTTTIDFATGAACDTIYMKKFPSDFGSSMYYFLKNNGDDFCLTIALSNKSDPDIASSQLRCASACGTSCSSTKYCICAD